MRNTKQAVAISQALDKVVDMRAESMEVDPSEGATSRNLKEATVIAEDKTMITVEDMADVEAIATMTADVVTTVVETDAAAIVTTTDGVETTVTQELTHVSNDQEATLNMSLDTTDATIATMIEEVATMEDSLSAIHMVTLELTLDSKDKEVILNRVMVEETSTKTVTPSKATAVVLTTIDHLTRNIPALLATMIDRKAKDTKEVTPATTTDLSSKHPSNTSKVHVKWETIPLIPSVLVTWTKAHESLIFAGTATPRMR